MLYWKKCLGRAHLSICLVPRNAEPHLAFTSYQRHFFNTTPTARTMSLQPVPNHRIDRELTTPFLLRLFYRERTFHSPAEFETVPPSPSLTDSSLDLYAWPDTTLSELTSLLSGSVSDILPSPSVGTRVGFRLIHPDTRSEDGRWLSKPLGTFVIGEDLGPDSSHTNGSNGHATGESQKTLADARYVIGDYVSCVIVPPLADGTVPPLPPSARDGPHRRGYANGRGGGYGGGPSRDVDRVLGRSSMVPSGEWARGQELPSERGDRIDRYDRGGRFR